MAKEKKSVALNVDNKEKALDDALKQIEKKFGKGSIMRLGDRPAVDIDVIPSGSLQLDAALGIGGYPKGRIIEIYGPESSGKTTLTLHAIAECQKQGGKAAFIDAEHAIDPVYAKNLGVDVDELILSQPDSGEQALEIAEMLVRSGVIELVVIDSVAALVPQVELDGEMSDQNMGLQARLMSKALRKLSGVMNKTNCTVIFINQLREKIGVMFGNPETTTGGRALKFYSSVRIEIRRSEQIKQNGEVIGNKTNIKVVKNKVAPPFKTTQVDIIYGKGISHDGEVLDLATQYDIVEKSGAWYAYKGEKIGQGRENAKAFLVSHPEIMAEVEQGIKNEMFGEAVEETSEEA
ncbi:recombinase RecA [Intestinibaculum porci]|jgi:recombination protein RecA|uniref:Protein RecA n=1 Tax=Intestinibaculum porci TaxID=2487118 RepID=A0A3G9J5H9_9FIRM|nr:recombinase RecA [Intestinibaculum porci]MDD6350325.1 recombinase RecA [Intestinibaculum porci]MDD6423476.1 recombinase RecA [Intestinibaculum porci]BBH26046.1 protein RecA [Intestinibaculum porci]HAN59114.1 recombinase RecA [Erysipelotrichaceae bacterium]